MLAWVLPSPGSIPGFGSGFPRDLGEGRGRRALLVPAGFLLGLSLLLLLQKWVSRSGPEAFLCLSFPTCEAGVVAPRSGVVEGCGEHPAGQNRGQAPGLEAGSLPAEAGAEIIPRAELKEVPRPWRRAESTHTAP